MLGAALSEASNANHSDLTEALVKQSIQALRVLLAGFDVANQRSREVLLRECSPTELYDSFTVAILRLIFLLYAVDRNLLSTLDDEDKLSLTKLIHRLEADAENDTKGMGQRFTGWKQVIEIFQLVGRQYATKGGLFDPDAYPLLGAKTLESDLPLVDDHCVHEVLQLLRYVENQPLSFQTLDIEHFGAVYEVLLSYTVEQATAPCLRLLPDGVVVSLEALRTAANPYKWLCVQLEEKKLPKSLEKLNGFTPSEHPNYDYDSLQACLSKRVIGRRILKGQHYVQSALGRRWSGAHYTPKELSAPVVEKTLSPLLGDDATEEQILALTVCDPAMGAGAFLATACRYLADRLVAVWLKESNVKSELDAVFVTHKARNMVAHHCLYGVDKNPRSVQLAQLCLWLLASNGTERFGFLRHRLKVGDSIVGCTRQQIDDVCRFDTSLPVTQKDVLYRCAGDVLIALQVTRARISKFHQVIEQLQLWSGTNEKPQELVALCRSLPFRPFHWELEFPAIFGRQDVYGFDAVLGNPPFAGKNTIVAANGDAYLKILKKNWPHSHGKSDLCSYFFVRAAEIVRQGGCIGLIASNTIDQGVTRQTGLQHIVNQLGIALYDVSIDQKWPVRGADVVLTIVHGMKSEQLSISRRINGRVVQHINSELDDLQELTAPLALHENQRLAFQGSTIHGIGFVVSAAEYHDLIREDQKNQLRLKPYLGGKELNHSPHLKPHRFAIDLNGLSLQEAAEWPDLLAIVRTKVKPHRDRQKRRSNRELWWVYGESRPGLYRAIQGLRRCLVCARVTKHLLFAFQPIDQIFSDQVVVFADDSFATFAVLQSQVHMHWAWKMSSTMGVGLRYTPLTCFQTFSFPRLKTSQKQKLTLTGQALYEKRSALMVEQQIGLTELWNRLTQEHHQHYHDEGIARLRTLRYVMDKAVLEAYGWEDIEPSASETIIARLRRLNKMRSEDSLSDTL